MLSNDNIIPCVEGFLLSSVFGFTIEDEHKIFIGIVLGVIGGFVSWLTNKVIKWLEDRNRKINGKNQ